MIPACEGKRDLGILRCSCWRYGFAYGVLVTLVMIFLVTGFPLY